MNEIKKRGRPKGSVGDYKAVKKDVQIAFRVTLAQKEQLQKAVLKSGMKQSEYILSKLF